MQGWVGDGLYAECPIHGRFSVFHLFGNVGTAFLQGNVTNCQYPGCTQLAPISNGVFDLAEEARRVFRQPGITRTQLESFKFAAQAVRSGKQSAATAQNILAKENAGFAALLSFTNGNSGALGVLIALISLFLLLYQIQDSDVATEQAHQDALNQLAATRALTEVTRSAQLPTQNVAQVQQRIDEEFVKLRAASQQQKSMPPPRLATPPEDPRQMRAEAAKPNRHARRAAKSHAQKKKR